MHWYHVINPEYKEECIWTRPHIVWESIREAMLISKSRRYGPAS